MDIKFDALKVKVVGIGELRPNSWNPKVKGTDEFERIKRGIQVKGLRLPIVVRENEGYEIIDGEQRWRACQELGYEKVIIYNEGVVTEQEARELTLWYQVQAPFDEIMLADLIGKMVEMPDLQIPFTEKEIEELAQLSKFDWDKFKQEELVLEQVVPTYNFRVQEDQLKRIQEIAREKEEVEKKEGEEENIKGQNDVKVTVSTKIPITADQKEMVMDAILKTEMKNKGEALAFICGSYLESIKVKQ